MNLLISLVGAGGLLGSALRRRAARRGIELVPFTGLPWSDPHEAIGIIERHHEDMLASGRFDGARWLMLWSAGGGSVGADPTSMLIETRLVAGLASSVRRLASEARTDTVLSFASSAGAVWSGATEPVLSEKSPPAPWHPYGEAKLEQEGILAEEARGSPWLRVRLARISNLYGPEPEDHPPSGLPGHLVANALRRVPTSIYVPMDTQRDYVYADHAAELMLDDSLAAFSEEAGSSKVDLVAAGSSHTITSLATTLSHVLTRRVPLTVGFSPLASKQPRILSFRSVERDLRSLNTVGLEVGLQRLVNERLSG